MSRPPRLIYRSFAPGDAPGLAHLFNVAFQANGVGFVKTAAAWRWRFSARPGFTPAQVHLCEDVAAGVIAGAVISEVERVRLAGRETPVGAINDVATHPAYAGHGIARRLFARAQEYLAEAGVPYSTLVADPRGFPRAKIYRPAGYADFQPMRVLLRVLPPATWRGTTWRWLGPLLPAVVLVALTRRGPRWEARATRRAADRARRDEATRPIPPGDTRRAARVAAGALTLETTHYRATRAYWRALARVGPLHYAAFPEMTAEDWAWRREHVPARRFRPSEVLLRAEKRAVAGVTLTHHAVRATRAGLRLRIGVATDFFVDGPHFLATARAAGVPAGAYYHAASAHLLAALLRAAARRHCAVVLLTCPAQDAWTRRAFAGHGFLDVSGGVHMLKVHASAGAISPPAPRRPWFVPTNDALTGFP